MSFEVRKILRELPKPSGSAPDQRYSHALELAHSTDMLVTHFGGDG